MPEPMSGCWLWIGALQPRRHGAYGVFQKLGATTSHNAHTFAYEFLRGPVPPRLELDHTCRNTQCVNPAHLEAVTRRVNLLRSYNMVAINAKKTQCPHGHAYDENNTGLSITKEGYRLRYCRACRQQRARTRALRKVDRSRAWEHPS